MAKEEKDDSPENAEGAESKPGFNAKKLIIFIVLPLLLLGGVGGGLYFSGFLDSYLGGGEACVEEKDDHGEVIKACPEESKDHAAADGHAPAADSHAPVADAHGAPAGDGHGGPASAFVEIPTMIVNLNTDPDEDPRFLRLTVQLELKNPAEGAAVKAVIPRVTGQFQTYLRELRVNDLRGSAGMYRLQMELLWRVNQASAPVEIKDVLFQEILIQ